MRTSRTIFLLISLVFALLGLYSCSSPFMINLSPEAKAQFALSFVISGSDSSRSSTNDPGNGNGSRLLLPTAKILVVQLIPRDEKKISITQRVDLSGTKVSVAFTGVPLGEYKVQAKAYAADASTELFFQESPLTVGAANNSTVAMNLVPSNPSVVPTLTNEALTAISIPIDSSRTWRIPAGSPFFNGTRGRITCTEVTNPAELLFYVQAIDGKVLESGNKNSPHIVNNLPTNVDLYFTLYNASATPTSTLSYQVVHSVSYMATNSISGSPPVDPQVYVKSEPLTIQPNTRNLRGQHIQHGITQRLMGWSTNSNATVPDPSITMGESDLILYPVWTTTSTSSSANGMNGMVGPAGGYVFYDKGMVGNGWRYLEVSPVDLAKSGVPWAETAISVSTTDSYEPSSWQENTRAICAATSTQGDNAAKLCADYTLNGYSDWYLPSPNALLHIYNKLYSNLPPIGALNVGLGAPAYWSSELNVNTNPVYFNFGTGVSSAVGWPQNSSSFGVRAVRAFADISTPYMVSYNANGGTGTVPVDSVLHTTGQTITPPGISNTALQGPLIQDGIRQRLLGWSINPNAIAPDSSFTITNADLVLYAVWTKTSSSSAPGAMERMIGPAGGFVFHDKGSVSDGWRYLEAAPVDQSTASKWADANFNISLGSDYIFMGNTALGLGAQNTRNLRIRFPGSTTAFYAATAYNGGGKNDWFLPSVDELKKMYTVLHLSGLGGFSLATYLPSCASGYNGAYYVQFTNGQSYDSGFNTGTSTGYVRAIRAFKSDVSSYKVTYNANGATSGTLPSGTFCYTPGQSVTVKSNSGALSKDGTVAFLWNTAANGSGTAYVEGPGSFIMGAGDVTLYAQWSTVYTAGSNEGAPGYWKNKTWVPFGATAGYAELAPISIRYANTSVYVLTSLWDITNEATQAGYWNNGILSVQPRNNGHDTARAFDVYNNSVYVLGTTTDLSNGTPRIVYWKDSGAASTLSTISGEAAYTCVRTASTLHFAGTKSNQAYYSYEGNPGTGTLLSGGTAVYSLAVAGSNLYAVGTNGGTEAVLWTSLNSGGSWSRTLLWAGSSNCAATKVLVDGGNVYVVGTNGNYAMYQKNSDSLEYLYGSGVQASSIAVNNGNVYISGSDNAVFQPLRGNTKGLGPARNAILWVNGSPVTLSTGSTAMTQATDLVFVP